MPSSGSLRRVALVKIDILEERIASIIRELGTLAVTSNRSTLIIFTLMMKAIRSSETSVLTSHTT
jgi:hypothetical protein